jgi:uncharacterized membrane protein
MKLKYFLIIIIISVFPKNIFAETIQSFNSQIIINKDRSILIEENILYDFENSEKRGIYRNISTKNIKIQDNIYTLHNGKESTQQISRDLNNIEIRIGDEDIFLTGVNEYNISYSVKGVIKKLQDRDELYWQITGTEWTAPIEKASATIILPENLQDKVGDKLYCYTGVSSSTAQDCTITWTNARTIEITANQSLVAGEGLTFAIGFPLGTLTSPTWWEENQEVINQSIAGGILVIGSLILYFVWNTWARDPKIHKPIVRQYDTPKGLSPAEIIRLKNNYPSSIEITATIILLAQQGFININKIKEKNFFHKEIYEFELKSDKMLSSQASLKSFEKELLDIFFKDGRKTVDTEDLVKENISSKFGEIYKSVYKNGVSQYYVVNPIKLRTILIILSIVLTAVGWIVFTSISIWIGVAIFIIESLTIILIFYSPKRTEEGTRVLEHILGFEEYIKTAEKNRLQFQEKEQIFFEILPYAIALGHATIWAKAFEGLIEKNPEWYHSNSGGVFLPVNFVNSFNSTMSSGVASSGGGSVGGGSGGGGGGSW